MEAESFKPPQPLIIKLTFEKEYEASALADELQRWSPTGGWSEDAMRLFEALKQER